jgi:hypothetical protein
MISFLTRNAGQRGELAGSGCLSLGTMRPLEHRYA